VTATALARPAWLRVPDSARGREIEWPPGSGRIARYDGRELLILAALIRGHKAGRCTAAELRSQVDLIHDAKVELGAHFE
jgi:hypothetical protein